MSLSFVHSSKVIAQTKAFIGQRLKGLLLLSANLTQLPHSSDFLATLLIYVDINNVKDTANLIELNPPKKTRPHYFSFLDGHQGRIFLSAVPK